MPRLIHREKRRVLGQLACTEEEASRIRAAAARASLPVMRWARETLLTIAEMQAIQENLNAME